MTTINYTRLSKTMSHALRHAPEKYGITLDTEGWTDLPTFIQILQNHKRHFAPLTEQDILNMMATANKQRYEVKNGKIRAVYGHSITQKIAKTATEPPRILYHGTARRTVPLIQKSGLKSMGRQYVHLSAEVETATMVGKRHDKSPVILEVRALEASQNGILFYKEENDIWLAEDIPADFIDF